MNQFSIHAETETRFNAEAWQFPNFIVLRIKIGDTTVETYLRDESQLQDFIQTINDSPILHKTPVTA